MKGNDDWRLIEADEYGYEHWMHDNGGIYFETAEGEWFASRVGEPDGGCYFSSREAAMYYVERTGDKEKRMIITIQDEDHVACYGVYSVPVCEDLGRSPTPWRHEKFLAVIDGLQLAIRQRAGTVGGGGPVREWEEIE